MAASSRKKRPGDPGAMPLHCRLVTILGGWVIRWSFHMVAVFGGLKFAFLPVMRQPNGILYWGLQNVFGHVSAYVRIIHRRH